MTTKEKVWTTKDGRTMAIRHMTTQHIINTIAMLRRNGFVSVGEFHNAWYSYAALDGDSMAAYYAEQEVATMTPTQALDDLEEELNNRRLR